MSFAVQQSLNVPRKVHVKATLSSKQSVGRFAYAPKRAVISRARCVVKASEKTDEIIESLKSLTLMEASELVTQMEDVFGISTAAMAAAPAAGAAAAGGAAGGEAVEEKTEFDVILEGVKESGNRIKVIKVVRALTGLGLKEAKGVVEDAPKPVKEGVSKEQAEDAMKQLEEAGATAKID